MAGQMMFCEVPQARDNGLALYYRSLSLMEKQLDFRQSQARFCPIICGFASGFRK